MEVIIESLSGITGFLLYLSAAIISLIVFSLIYSWITPYNEVELIKNNNPAAATVFVGALIGFALPLYSALDNSVSLIDFGIWTTIALFIQILTFILVRKLVYPKLSERIEAGEIAAAIKVAGVAIVIGLINAGSMTY
jgi:putative membrane protein